MPGVFTFYQSKKYQIISDSWVTLGNPGRKAVSSHLDIGEGHSAESVLLVQ